MTADLFTTLLFFAPALLLALSLLLGYRPGERLLIRWALGRGRRFRYPSLQTGPVHGGWVRINPRGGHLLARSLAGRAPPRFVAPRKMFGRRALAPFP